MHDGQDKSAAIHHHLLATQTGTHKGPLFGTAQVEPVQQPDRNGDDDRDDDQTKNETAELSAAHVILPLLDFLTPAFAVEASRRMRVKACVV